MTEQPSLSFSVIIASRGRPDWLERCLRAVLQLDYPAFEVVVVADPDGLERVKSPDVKSVLFDRANLSAARNLGATHAAGDVCAFIDDDAVPEPMWLRHHAAAFTRIAASASVGYVRGRNGISFQSRAGSVDREGETHAVLCETTTPEVPYVQSGRALKLVGTNMTVQRDVFLDVGGFDETFRFFLEDADLSMRLASAGHKSAVAPHAEVHHGFGASPRRSAQRLPLDLFDIGRSSVLYWRKHASVGQDMLKERVRERERKRLIRHLVRGTCEPQHVKICLSGLEKGFEDGSVADLERPKQLVSIASPFQRVLPQEAHVVKSCRLLARRKTLREAGTEAAQGRRVSLFSFSLTPVRQHVRYTKTGVWFQSGGQFGRSDRGSPWFRWCRFADRLREEIGRVAKQRGLHDTDGRSE